MIRLLASYRQLAINLAIKDFKVRYKSALLGFLWMFLLPIFQMVVLSVIFSYYIRIQTDVLYPLFLLTGLLPWNFLSISLSTGTYSFIEQANLVKKVQFPREIIPFSVVLGHSFNFCIALSLFIPVALILLRTFSIYMLLIPLWICAFIIFTMLLTAITAAINVFFRDMRYIIEAFVMLWFYGTPIFYPISTVPEQFRIVYFFNPAAAFIDILRSIVLYARLPDIPTSLYCMFIILILGLIYFGIYNKKRSTIADYL